MPHLLYPARFGKIIENCTHPDKSDFSFFKNFLGDDTEKEEHFFCPDCRTHWYRGKEWKAEEWDRYVNDMQGTNE